jgi:uroporphyrinogen decarboxylase
MGAEELLVSFYDDPDLVNEIMTYMTGFWLKIYEKVCEKVNVNVIHMWEDMSGKNGSLISPDMVREFMMPNYKRIADFAKNHNIPVFSLDTDGDCSQLVPLYLESGINMIMPFEVAAGSDINKYRKLYPNLCIMGGIDKREIAKGPASIDKELDRIDSMFKGPGYWPALDHLVHPEISYNDFKYFVAALWERIEKYRSSQLSNTCKTWVNVTLDNIDNRDS